MMLWDIIRDWFVMYIFGGHTHNLIYGGQLGVFMDLDFNEYDGATSDFYLPIGPNINGGYSSTDLYISLGDWLSTTSTIIVLILMCVFLFLCVRYLFKVGAGLFSNLRG